MIKISYISDKKQYLVHVEYGVFENESPTKRWFNEFIFHSYIKHQDCSHTNRFFDDAGGIYVYLYNSKKNYSNKKYTFGPGYLLIDGVKPLND